MKLLLLPLALGVLPVLLGLPWTRLIPSRRGVRSLLCWPLGYFLALALFELLAVPFTLLQGSFFVLAPVYSGLLTALAAVSLGVYLRQRRRAPSPREKAAPLSYWEWLYLVAFLGIAGFTVVRAITWDTTTMNYDDAEYLTRAADALAHGKLLGINASTGLAEPIQMKRALQGSLFFPAWLGSLSGLSVTVIARTVLETVHLVMAYTVFAAMAGVLGRKREDALIFLVLVSLLYLMGHYSHYSPTFRLLGPNYQGKATLAVLFFPLVFTLMMCRLEKDYSWAFGLLLALLSVCAVSLTLFGTVTMVMNVALPVAAALVRRPRRWGLLGYVVWASVIPTVCAAAYIFS